MTLETTTATNTPTVPTVPTPSVRGYLDIPIVRHVLGIIVSVLLVILSQKFGITPTPIPVVPLATPTVLVINTGGVAPGTSIAAIGGK